MKKNNIIKEVTIFFPGDSSKINSWSNIPYFFTKTLIDRGIKINQVDISTSPFFDNFYDRTICRIWRKISPKTTWGYYRSFFHHKDLQNRIKKAAKNYPNSDLHIFIASFAFPLNRISNKPTIVLGDWTLEHTIRYFQQRTPDFMERIAIKRESQQIEAADMVLSLFPGCTEELKNQHENQNIFYIGNVVNSLFEAKKEEILPFKRQSNDILFIGRSKYIEGAKVLITAFIQLKRKYPLLKLHLVGLTESHFGNLPEDVFCHGYLDKGSSEGQRTYYELLKKAKFFVNTTPEWGTFSASVEAMYFFTPVVIPPYDEFVNTFGKDISMGVYCDENIPERVTESIMAILNSSDYEIMCINAHNAVKEFTWDEYINRFFQKVKDLDMKIK